MAIVLYAYSAYIKQMREEQCNFEGPASEKEDLARVLEQIIMTKVTHDSKGGKTTVERRRKHVSEDYGD
jgi:hypothetical protein